ncbi:MAG TPA: hypothetical protein VJQ25_01030, partial [Nitrospira sp.]|nr:hypothetical protein [Nitrospira sp.]
HWERYREQYSKLTTLEWRQEYSTVEKDGAKYSSEMNYYGRRNGKLLKNAFMRKGRPITLFIANDSYAAEIRRKGDEEGEPWSFLALNFLSSGGDSAVDRALLATQEGEWKRCFGLAGMSTDVLILDPRWCDIVSIQNDGGLLQVRYAKNPSRLPDDAKADASLSPIDSYARSLLLIHPEGQFTFDPKTGYAITRFEGRNPKRLIVNVETFSDYRQVDNSVWFPYRMDRSSTEGEVNGPQRVMTGVQTPTLISTKVVDSDEFYVSFYGLPEPAGVVRRGWTPRTMWTLVAVVLGIGLIVIASVRHRRGAQ